VTRRSLVAAIAIALAACGGDDHAAIDAGSDASGDAPTALGTWDAPIVIAALPYTATGDTAAATEVRAEGYDCAATIDERGAEVVYRLDLAAPTIVTIAVDAAAPIDVDVHVLRAAATGALATGCLTRDDRAFVVDLAAGSWWIAVDTYAGGAAPAAGAYTLTVTAPRSSACLTNPIPACQAGDAPDVNGAPTPPPGLGGCPAGMARVAGFCIDRWEAALVGADGRGWSPYKNPGTAAVVAVSAPGLVPQGYVNQTQATAACAAAGKRLCTDTEWLRACQGADRQHLSLRRHAHARRVQRRARLPPGGAVLRVERQLGVLDDRPQLPRPAARRAGPHRRPRRLRLGRRPLRPDGQPARVDRRSRRHLPRRLLRRHHHQRQRLPLPHHRPRRLALGLLDRLPLLRRPVSGDRIRC
jgi:hypothetical protein